MYEGLALLFYGLKCSLMTEYLIMKDNWEDLDLVSLIPEIFSF